MDNEFVFSSEWTADDRMRLMRIFAEISLATGEPEFVTIITTIPTDTKEELESHREDVDLAIERVKEFRSHGGPKVAAEQNTVDVQDNILIHIVSDGETTKGWVHTHGMSKFDKPELEIRNVPLFLCNSAGRLINELCDFLLNTDAVVTEGQTIQLSDGIPVRVVKSVPIPGDEEHFVSLRWLVTDANEGYCSVCQSGAPHTH